RPNNDTKAKVEEFWANKRKPQDQEFANLLEDIDVSSLKLREKHLDVLINNQDDLKTVLDLAPKVGNGVKKLELILETSSEDVEQYETEINLATLLNRTGSIDECNETERCQFISAILYGALDTLSERDVKMRRELFLSRISGRGRPDYTIKKGDDILCTVEAKMTNIEHGFCQNLVQLQCAVEQYKKRKHDCLEYVYGVVTTGDKWYFTLVNSNNEVGAISEPLMVSLNNSNVTEEVLKSDIGNLFSVIRTILLDKLKSFEEPKKRSQKIVQLIGPSSSSEA
ncbi:17409_t:CDS:2, partial [Racocetra fulgida]